MYAKAVLVSYLFRTWSKRCSLSISVFLIVSFQARAQIIVPGKFIDERYPVFNDSIISEQSIESITIRVMRKPSSRPIYDDGRRISYHFNDQGRLISYQKVVPSRAGRVDTSSITFIYRNDILQARSEKIGKYRKRIAFNYINTHHIVETIKVKHGDMDWDELGKEEVQRSETLSNQQWIITEKKGGINETPYQQNITILNQALKPVRKEMWHRSRLIGTETFEYSNNLLYKYSIENIQKGSSIQVEYKTSSVLQDEGKWCENEICKTWSIVYHETGLPKAFILMNTETQDMEIWEYRSTHR
jgi:hypothetical protein